MSFAKNSLNTLVSNMIIIAIGFVTSVIISNQLGPQLQGVYNLAILMPTMMYSFLNFGQDVSMLFYLSNKTITKKDAINNMIPMVIVYSIVSTLLGLIFIVLFKERIFKDIPFITLAFALIISPLTYLNNMLSSVLKSEGRFKSLNKIQVINKFIYFAICTTLFLFVNVNIVILANIIILLISILTIWKRIAIKRFKPIFNKEFQRNNISYGFKSYLSNMITFLNYRVDSFIISAMSTTVNVGQYSLAVSLVEQVWIFSTSISTVMFPYVTSIENDEEKSKVTSTTFKIVMLFTLIVIAFLYFTADFLITLIYDNRYVDSIAPFKVLLVGIFSLSLGRILANDIAARGKPELNALSNFVGLIINVVLNVILIPKIGIVGAAVATSVSYTVTSTMFVISFLKLTKLRVVDLFIFSKSEVKLITGFVKNILKR